MLAVPENVRNLKSDDDCRVDVEDIDELVYRTRLSMPPDLKDELYKFMRRHHIDAPKIATIMGAKVKLIDFTEELEILASTASESSPHSDVRGAAYYLLACCYVAAADLVATLDELEMSMTEYLSMMYPNISDGDRQFLKVFYRWENKHPAEVRNRAIHYVDELSRNYSMTPLRFASRKGPGYYLDNGRVGKKAKSMEFALRNAAVGQPLQPLKLGSKSGEVIDIERYRGKPTVIYIWSSSCGPCKKSLPYYSAAYKSRKSDGRDIEILALNVDENLADLEAFLKQNPLPFDIGWIGAGKTLHEWCVDGFPTALILDRNMTLKIRGQIPEDLLLGALNKMM